MHKKVVVLGGGTGMSRLIKGLKEYPIDITSVISVSDNGRSTGKLRREFNTPAVGDIRQLITHLSETDDNIKQLMEYRFHTSSDLDGHAMGNLILTAMFNITGSLKESIEALGKLFDIKHTLLPVSEDSNLTLMGESKNGKIIEGEANITKCKEDIIRIFYKEEPVVLDGVIKAILEADLIIISMGSLFTSILPNIICKQVKSALNSSKAPMMYICNPVTQPGETDDFTVSDHVELINSYLDHKKIDVVIASNTNIDEETAKKYYNKEQKSPVKIDYARMKKLDSELIEADLLEIENNLIRHNSIKIGALVMNYLMRD